MHTISMPQINILVGLGCSVLYLSALICNSYPMAVIVANVIYIYIIIYCLHNMRRNILVLTFCASFMFFFLGQPTLSFLFYNDQFSMPINSSASIWWGINSAFLAMLGILLGSSINISVPMYRKIEKNNFKQNTKYIQILFEYLSYLALFSNFYISCKKMLYMLNYGYVAYFAYYDMSDCNLFARFWARALFLCLSIYLATLPSKKKSAFVLILYVLSMFPNVLGGGRGGFMLAIAFSFLYMYIRAQPSLHLFNNKRSWSFGKKEFLLLVTVGILFIFCSEAIEHVRTGSAAALNLNIFESLVRLIYNQSGTFCHMANAQSLREQLSEFNVFSYTLGPIIDTLLSQYISRIVFHTPAITGQNMDVLFNTQNLAHHISYLLLGNRYFDGAGVGSSYLLELYLDSGFGGIFIFNVILGVILKQIAAFPSITHLGKRIFLIYTMTTIIFLPRSSALGMIAVLFNMVNIIILLILLFTIAVIHCRSKVKVKYHA